MLRYMSSYLLIDHGFHLKAYVCSLFICAITIILFFKKESTPQLVHNVELSIQQKTSKQTIINPKGKTIETRFYAMF